MLRIAMWSGPRNISTAMMRSWENRSDTVVVDEPLYGPYLHRTKKQHPMHKEIIENQGQHSEKITTALTEDKLPIGKSIYYQKHMCQHIDNKMDISWLQSVRNVFLIRDPHYVVASFVKKHKSVMAEDLGFPQQLRLFNYVQQHCGYTPIVLDSKDVLRDPKTQLELLCERLKVTFENSMLNWPKGYRNTDGIWASHWYNRVIETTEFGKYHPKKIELTTSELKVAEECMPYYLALVKNKPRL